MKGRGSRKTVADSDSASSDATDELYELLEAESEEEAGAASSLSDHLDSDGSEYVPQGRNAKRAAAIKGNFIIINIIMIIMRISNLSGDDREALFLFQHISVTIQRFFNPCFCTIYPASFVRTNSRLSYVF